MNEDSRTRYWVNYEVAEWLRDGRGRKRECFTYAGLLAVGIWEDRSTYLRICTRIRKLHPSAMLVGFARVPRGGHRNQRFAPIGG